MLYSSHTVHYHRRPCWLKCYRSGLCRYLVPWDKWNGLKTAHCAGPRPRYAPRSIPSRFLAVPGWHAGIAEPPDCHPLARIRIIPKSPRLQKMLTNSGNGFRGKTASTESYISPLHQITGLVSRSHRGQSPETHRIGRDTLCFITRFPYRCR